MGRKIIIWTKFWKNTKNKCLYCLFNSFQNLKAKIEIFWTFWNNVKFYTCFFENFKNYWILESHFTINSHENEFSFTHLPCFVLHASISGYLVFLKMRKTGPDILACNYVWIYLHASFIYFPNDLRLRKLLKISLNTHHGNFYFWGSVSKFT